METMSEMDMMVDKIHRAVRASDYRELRRIVHQLVFIGACDHERAKQILEENASM